MSVINEKAIYYCKKRKIAINTTWAVNEKKCRKND